jgi:hypothetical protein
MGAKGKSEEWLLPENLIRIQGWARDGLSEEQIAHNMGIVTSTLYEWKKKFSELSNAVKINKDIADRQIENALYKAAKDGNITAQIFWLKNRKPKEWRDKQEMEHSGDLKLNANIRDANTDELIEKAKELGLTQEEIEKILKK